MWPEILMAHQGSSLSNTIMYPKVAKQQHRGLRILAPSLSIAPGKSFKNPNFVNNFDKYENGVKPVDSMRFKNSCHAHIDIVDSIKLRCPKVITSLQSRYSATELNRKMCLHNIKNNHKNSNKGIGKILQEETFQDLSNNFQNTSLNSQHQSLVIDQPSTTYPPPSKIEHTDIPFEDSQPMFQERQNSVTDSEESSIISDCQSNDEDSFGDRVDNSESGESVCLRKRYPSVCESEDSFIMFERDDVTILEDCIYSQSSSEDDCVDSSDNEEQENIYDEVDSSYAIIDHRKVRFASADKLCKVHPMIKWSYAYQAARKGPWEMYARDRARFKERVLQVERDIQHVFNPEYRAKIYKERFENL